MTKTNYTITKYDCGNDYFVEVSDSESMTGWKDFYIYKKDYSVKAFMFGIAVEDADIESIIEANIDDYILMYETEYE